MFEPQTAVFRGYSVGRMEGALLARDPLLSAANKASSLSPVLRLTLWPSFEDSEGQSFALSLEAIPEWDPRLSVRSPGSCRNEWCRPEARPPASLGC